MNALENPYWTQAMRSQFEMWRKKPLADYSESRFGQEPCEAERKEMFARLYSAKLNANARVNLFIGHLILTAAIVACFCL